MTEERRSMETENTSSSSAGTKEAPDQPGILDKIQQNLVSRKLLVFVVGTVAFFQKTLSGDEWLTLALVYVGSLALVDLAVAWKKAGR
jgi:uncharacterized membrane protein YjjP (DUF1212 family)